MLTAYDYSIAKIIDQAGVDIVLVGDSLGNVILGHKNTCSVTMADMIHHTKAVRRGVKKALLVADLPYRSMSQPVKNAKSLVKAGAEAVKIEGIKDLPCIKAIFRAGIPVMGHLGILPQTAKSYKIQHTTKIINQAKKLEAAGVFALVLEMVAPKLAQQVAAAVNIPVIGIGSGPFCDGQVLVTYDLIGLSDWAPRFVKPKANVAKIAHQAIKEFIREVSL